MRHRTGTYTVCRRVRAAFSLVTLRAGAVKGLKILFRNTGRCYMEFRLGLGHSGSQPKGDELGREGGVRLATFMNRTGRLEQITELDGYV